MQGASAEVCGFGGEQRTGLGRMSPVPRAGLGLGQRRVALRTPGRGWTRGTLALSASPGPWGHQEFAGGFGKGRLAVLGC